MSLEKKTAQRLARKIQRGIVTLVYEREGIQWLQVKTRNGDVHEAPRIQECGFTSVPHEGAEATLLMINDSDAVVIGVDDGRHRPHGSAAGETIIYDDEGTVFHIKRGGKIYCEAATEVKFQTPNVFFSGNIVADGDITDRAKTNTVSMNQVRDKYDSHDHDETGSVTNSPNQVFVESGG
jgi:phage baseplate assembly protein V